MSILIERTKRHEGFRSRVYRDRYMNLTIGYGWCIDRRGITEDQAEYILTGQLKECELEVKYYFPWTNSLDELRFGVLVEMDFQIGIGGLNLFAKFLDYLRLGDYENAAKEMLDSKWYKEDSPKRAKELSEIIRTGKEAED